jgi:hypothetical protein
MRAPHQEVKIGHAVHDPGADEMISGLVLRPSCIRHLTQPVSDATRSDLGSRIGTRLNTAYQIVGTRFVPIRRTRRSRSSGPLKEH